MGRLSKKFGVLLLTHFFIVNAANAQFSDNPISVAVDDTSVDYFFTNFEPQNDTCTRGEWAITSKLEGSGLAPSFGFFSEGFRSLSIDLQVSEEILLFPGGFENIVYLSSFDRFGRPTILWETISSTNGWRRIVIPIPENSVDISLSYEPFFNNEMEAMAKGGAVKIDNVSLSQSIRPFSNIAIQENGCVPEPPSPVSNVIPSIMSLLMDEEAVQEQLVHFISGSFSLPDGVTATEDIVYELVTEPLESFRFEGENYLSSNQITISPENSKPLYELPLPPDSEDKSYKIRFRCLSGCERVDVTTHGYWRDSITGVVGEGNARAFPGGMSHQENIQMELARIFSGDVSFSAELPPDGSEFFSVNLISLNQEDPRFWNIYSAIIQTEMNQLSNPFRVGVPEDDPAPTAGWFLYVNCIFCGSEFEQGLQYATNSLSGDPLSVDLNHAVLFPKSLGLPFIDLSLSPLAAE